MLYTGTNIRHSQIERLKPIAVEAIANQIKNADAYLLKQIKDIMDAMPIDKKLANELKKTLPYFIGATFKNNMRKSENFVSIQYFTLDFDHCDNFEHLNSQIEAIKSDHRILLMFKSPSGKGLKCVFRLEEPCSNSIQFSSFFKAFGASFAKQYNLESFLDYQTSDVTRVCFISADHGCFYNPDSAPVKMPEVFKKEDENKPAMETTAEQPDAPTKKEKKEIPVDIYKKIAATLDSKFKGKKPKQIFVPDELNYAVPIITQAVEQYDFKIKDISDINYGKKITFIHGLSLGELNIYYGKNGFQVVKSGRTGLNKDFTDLLHQIASAELGQLNQTTDSLRYKFYAS
jgi:hypothetical protein